MNKIITLKELRNKLIQGYGIKYYRNPKEMLMYGILVDTNGKETNLQIEGKALFKWLSPKQEQHLRTQWRNGKTPTFKHFEKIEIEREKEFKKQEVKEAIEYFKGFWEGDNITITSDFLNNLEVLFEALK